MRKIFILLIACVSVCAQAQEKYSVVLERTKSLSPYEAIYELMDYQYWKPELAAVYYELGNHCYSLLPTRDPLHHYTELSTLLYQSRLFYGNCLHFAKDQKLPGWQYSEIAEGQKKIEYATLEAYVRPRLKEVERQQIACDSIYHTFNRMSDRYNRCLTLFSTFLEAYTREKTAHLELQPGERDMLIALQREADTLEIESIPYVEYKQIGTSQKTATVGTMRRTDSSSRRPSAQMSDEERRRMLEEVEKQQQDFGIQ